MLSIWDVIISQKHKMDNNLHFFGQDNKCESGEGWGKNLAWLELFTSRSLYINFVTVVKYWVCICPYYCLCTQKIMFFPSFFSPLYQGSTLSLTLVFASLVDFQIAHKMTSLLSSVAGKQDSKKKTILL